MFLTMNDDDIIILQAPGVYGKVDDEESVRLLNRALDIGCDFWDTASTFPKI